MSEQTHIEALAPAQLKRKVDGKEGWIDLGYVDGLPEFTVLQINLVGDYVVTEAEQVAILTYATSVVTHTQDHAQPREEAPHRASYAENNAAMERAIEMQQARVATTGEDVPVEGDP